MADTIWGRVTRVVDGDTIDVRVTHYHRGNSYTYSNDERVRLANRDAPERGTRRGAMATRALTARLQGRSVCIEITARDTYGRLVGNVEVQ